MPESGQFEPAVLALVGLAAAAFVWLPAALLLKRAMIWIAKERIPFWQAMVTTLGAAVFATAGAFALGFVIANVRIGGGAEAPMPRWIAGAIVLLLGSLALTGMIAGRYRLPASRSAIVATVTIALTGCYVAAVGAIWTALVAMA